ncbi:PIN domain-containing protein [Bifidobacterium callimiconis]|nr:PIN domain-containing protein [Bifidobacterium callimiconis]
MTALLPTGGPPPDPLDGSIGSDHGSTPDAFPRTSPRRALLDTNVLLDHLMRRNDAAEHVTTMLKMCVLHDVTLLCASTSLKDIAYISEMMIRRQFGHMDANTEARSEASAGDRSPLEAATIRMVTRRIPWHCVELARRICDIVAIDQTTCDEAMLLRDRHDDFADDLIIAAAHQSHCDVVITSDRKLIEHFPGHCVSPRRMTELLSAQNP